MDKRASVMADLRHDLLCGTVNSLEYEDELKISLLGSIVDKYFAELSVALEKPKVTYLTYFNYDQIDFGIYGHFWVDYLRNSKSTLVNIENKIGLIERYLDWIPVDLRTLREKLLAIRRVQINSASDSVPAQSVIDKAMVTCRTVDISSVNEQISRLSNSESQLDYLIDAISLSPETLANLKRLFNLLKESLSNSELSSLAPRLYSFGSMSNGLATWDSDFDLFLKFEAIKVEMLDYDTSMLALTVVREILKQKLGFMFGRESIIPGRRCPLVKMDFGHCLDGSSDLETGLKFVECDISIRSLSSVRNSKFFRFLARYDERFFEMAMLLRYWAKNRADLIGPGGISSYTLTMTIVFFLQNHTQPAVLPSVEHFIEVYRNQGHPTAKDWDFCDHVGLYAKSSNTKSTAELVVDYFKYYHTFDYRMKGMRIRTGETVDKEQMYRENRANSPDNMYFNSTYIAIEDPFERTNNAGIGFNALVYYRWKNEIGVLVCHVVNMITPENVIQILCRNRSPNAVPLSELKVEMQRRHEREVRINKALCA